jgi:hypothetical protein
MNLDTPATVTLDRVEPVEAQTLESTGFAVPDPAETSEVPEASVWWLLIVAAAIWLLRLRKRQSRTPGIR